MALLIPGAAGDAAGYDQPFDLLEACHQRVERSLALLARIVAHLQQRAAARRPFAAHEPLVDEAARQAAADVLRYFDVAAPLHHEDEERHVFPLLEAAARAVTDTTDTTNAADAAALLADLATLRADHQRFGQRWQPLRARLEAITAGRLAPDDLPALAEAASAFATGYAAHMACEHERVFPAAQACLGAQPPQQANAALQAMGREMAARRGLRR